VRVRLIGRWLGASALIFPLVGSAASAAVPHTVQPNETLWSIATANNFTTNAVAAFNGLPENADVVVGQTIQIPTEAEGATALASSPPASATGDPGVSATAAPDPVSTTSSSGVAHTIQPGETLWSIAQANDLSDDSLAAYNGIPSDAHVVAGQTIQLPDGAASSAAQPASGLAEITSPVGPLELSSPAAAAWNAMREESLRVYGQDLYPGGPLSAYRTYDQQAQLYHLYLTGQGPPAEPPGSSSHELGTAVDVATPEMRSVVDQIGPQFGWGKVHGPGEWWHVDYLGN